MLISSLDHIVITVHDMKRSIGFYTRVLGMELETFAEGRRALYFGSQKINLHTTGEEIKPHAQKPMPGATDLCFLTETPMQDVISHLAACKVTLIEGPVQRTGATGPLLSLYINDPDGNLIEIANTVNY